jgi:putative FmdB family regulatory protein
MPIYDYVCGTCGHRLEVIHGVHEHGPRFCSECGAEGSMRKAFAPPTIVFKGGGWAKKDRSSTAVTRAAAKDGSSDGSGPGASSTPGSSEDVASSGDGSSGSTGSGAGGSTGGSADGSTGGPADTTKAG